MIYCLMISGLPITNTIRDTLFSTACRMIREDKDELSIYDDECCGVIKTDWEHFCLGTIAGYEFSAEISTCRGDHGVTFLVREKDVDNIEKSQWLNIPIKQDPERN